ncbi:MAG: diguanylate cyclase, partial [Chitinispirillia bacterium]
MNGFLLSLNNQEIIHLFNGLLSHLTEAVIITDQNNRIQAVNSAFSMLTGYKPEEVLGKRPWFLKSDKQSKQFFKDMLSKLADTGYWQGKVWNRKKNGEICLVDLSLQQNIFKDKSYYIGIFSKLIHSKKFVYENINHDPLTNLPNRMLFQDHLKFMIAHARRNNQILALLLIDINRFKVMNETLGFNIGDTILVNTAQRLKEILREVDGVFRLGNDEFAIVLEEVSKMEDAAKVAKKILSVINNPYKLASYKEDLFISVSIGISLFPQDGTNGENLIKNAEAAMYQAKEIEQNNFQLYSPTMNARAFEHMTLEHRLHKASEQKEFTLYYQPIVDIKTKRIVAAEALIRWNHPELGLVSPATFIPIAEETGLIIPIGDYIMAVSCDKLKFWHTIGHSDIYISVNL